MLSCVEMLLELDHVQKTTPACKDLVEILIMATQVLIHLDGLFCPLSV